ncbi:unnamed protein product, partial [Effrenium voratum]
MTKHNRPWTTLITTWHETTFHLNDGTVTLSTRALAATVEKDIETSDSSDDGNQEPTVAKMTRKERKALDREIPWRTMMRGDATNVKANRKEYESWRSWGTITPLDDKEADEVLKCPTLRRRCGSEMPDLAAWAPTSPSSTDHLRLPPKFAELTVIQVAASGLCRQVELTGMEWGLWGGDVATAFLQGEPDARELPLFLRPPRDELQRRAKSFPHRLYSIEGNLYGFASAPKTWIKHVVRTLTVAQFLTHRLDHMCFYKRCSRGYLQVILIVHVDDFLVAFRKDYNMDELLGMFTWGNKAYLEKGKPLTFRGKQISLDTVNGKDVIKVTQTEFIQEMECGSIKRVQERVSGLEDNPDQTFAAKPTNLRDVLEGIKVAKETMTDGFTFQGIPLNRATTLVGFGDSSWANAEGHKSQMGVVVVITIPDCLERTTMASVLDWQSARSPRVTRSTLASEANSMDQCVDRMVYANYFLSEVLFDGQQPGAHLRQFQATDCKSLYDAVIAGNPSLSEKRTLIA